MNWADSSAGADMNNERDTRKQDLLRELGDVQSLLDDMDKPPLLEPAEAPQAAPVNNRLNSDQIRKLASERSNPFLPTASPPTTRPAPATASPAAPTLSAPRPTLSNTDIDRVIDELVAEALPKLEKALRLRLRDALRRKN